METLHAMGMRFGAAAVLVLAASTVASQTTNDPFPDPIPANDGVITVGVVEFASLPFVDGQPPRMMRLVDEPGTGRLFVSDMWGLVHTVSHDGKTVTQYLDLREPRWDVYVEASRRERGVPELRGAPAVRPARLARLRQALHLHRYEQYRAAGGLRAERRVRRTGYDPVGMDGRRSHRDHLRRRPAARVAAHGAAVSQPQRGTARLQSARGARRSGLRSSLYRLGGWRQRRRSARRRAEPRLDPGQGPAHRSARIEQRQRAVRHPRRQPLRE